LLSIDELPPIRPHRAIRGMAAVPLPLDDAGATDWGGFSEMVQRTADAGLTPAVNLDLGLTAHVDQAGRTEVLRRTREVVSGRGFVAGAFVADRPGDAFPLKAYLKQIEAIDALGGTPVVIPSYGLAHQDAEHVVNDYEAIAACCERFIALELDEQLAARGRMYGMTIYDALLGIPQCLGAVHAAFRRRREWRRLLLRDKLRPDFLVLSGNDLALDMVTYGSDYLLGLAAFAPDWFAVRDRLWRAGDARFYELNDHLQRIGSFAFREPVAAAAHSAVQFLKLRGWIQSDRTPSEYPQRPESDVDVLRDLLIGAETFVEEIDT
jgi:dihydrodipicolinate synthase/N-acetylneuraminate lyase